MEFLIEIVLEVFGEIILQVVLQSLAEVGLHSARALRDPARGQPAANPFFATLGYLLFGTIVGLVSLWVRPQLFIVSHALRMANLLITPLAAGLAMMMLGAWRRRREQVLVRMDRFAYGFVFALATSATRYIVAA